MATDDFDQTQAIALDEDPMNDDTDDLDPDAEKKPASFLKIPLQKGLNESNHPLFEGDNIIGRNPDTCHVYISSKSLSKEHACIQIVGDVHMIFDKGSRNKTRRGKLFLSPDVRYELKDGEELMFADVKCTYQIAKQTDTVAESGSETDGSESLMLKYDATNESALDVTGVQSGTSFAPGNNADDSVLPPTQTYSKENTDSKVMVNDTPESVHRKKVQEKDVPMPTLVLSESESEDEEPVTGNRRGIKDPSVQETLLCEDTDDETSRDKPAFSAATQAYAPKNVNDSEDDNSRHSLIGAATQAYGVHVNNEDEEELDEKASNEPTQAFAGFADSDELLKSTGKAGAKTSSKENTDTSKPQGNNDSSAEATQVFEEDEEEEDTGENPLFAASTLACDDGVVYDEVETEEEDGDADNNLAGPNDATQVFSPGSMSAKPKADVNGNSDTVDVEKAVAKKSTGKTQGDSTVVINDTCSVPATVVIPGEDATMPVIAEPEKLPKRKGKSDAPAKKTQDRPGASDLPTQVIDAEDDSMDKDSEAEAETQVFGVSDTVATQVFGVSDTVTVEDVGSETKPAEELTARKTRAKRGPGTSDELQTRPKRDKTKKVKPVEQVTNTMIIADDNGQDCDTDAPTQQFETSGGLAEGKDGATVLLDEPTQAYGDSSSDLPTQVFAPDDESQDFVSGRQKADVAALKKNTKSVKSYENDEGEENSDSEKPWKTGGEDEPTQAYGVVDGDDDDDDDVNEVEGIKVASDEATQAYGLVDKSDDEDGDDDEKQTALSEEPTQAYAGNECDLDATQPFEDGLGNTDEIGVQGASKQSGLDEPTQKYEMLVETARMKKEEDGKTVAEDSEDDSDLEEESVLKMDAAAEDLDYDRANQMFDVDKNAEEKEGENQVEPTLQYTMAVQDGSLSPEIPDRSSEAPVPSFSESKESLTDTEEIVPDSMANSDVEDKPVIPLPLPSRSPLKPAIVDRRRSPSPARKQVAFAEPEAEDGKESREQTVKGRKGRKRKTNAESPSKVEGTDQTKLIEQEKTATVLQEKNPDSTSSSTPEKTESSKVSVLSSSESALTVSVDSLLVEKSSGESPSENTSIDESSSKSHRSTRETAAVSSSAKNKKEKKTDKSVAADGDAAPGGCRVSSRGRRITTSSHLKDYDTGSKPQGKVTRKSMSAPSPQLKQVENADGKETGFVEVCEVSEEAAGEICEKEEPSSSLDKEKLVPLEGDKNNSVSSGKQGKGKQRKKGKNQPRIADLMEEKNSQDDFETTKASAAGLGTSDGEARISSKVEAKSLRGRGRKSTAGGSKSNVVQMEPGVVNKETGDNDGKEKISQNIDSVEGRKRQGESSVVAADGMLTAVDNVIGEIKDAEAKTETNEEVPSDKSTTERGRKRGRKSMAKESQIVATADNNKDDSTSKPKVAKVEESNAEPTTGGRKSSRARANKGNIEQAGADNKHSEEKTSLRANEKEQREANTALSDKRTRKSKVKEPQAEAKVELDPVEQPKVATVARRSKRGHTNDDNDNCDSGPIKMPSPALSTSSVGSVKGKGRAKNVRSSSRSSHSQDDSPGTEHDADLNSNDTAEPPETITTGRGRRRRTTGAGKVIEDKRETETVVDSEKISEPATEKEKNKSEAVNQSKRTGRNKSNITDKKAMEEDSMDTSEQDQASQQSQRNQGKKGKKRAASSKPEVTESQTPPKSFNKAENTSASQQTAESDSQQTAKSRSRRSIAKQQPVEEFEDQSSQSSPSAAKKRKPSPPPSTPSRRGNPPTHAPVSTPTSSRRGNPSTPAPLHTPTPSRRGNPSTPAPADSPSLRKSTLNQQPKVMFTGVIDEQGEKILKDLGGELVSNIHDCTHLVTDKVRRTVKFLAGLAKGALIVTPQWLESSKRAGTFLDGNKFLVVDHGMEKQYRFSLQSSIDRANCSSLLQGYSLHVTPSVKPDPQQMKDIILCAGAKFLAKMPGKTEPQTMVISCPEDQALWSPAASKGISVVGAEFILTGILRQEVQPQAYELVSTETTGKSRGRHK